MSQPISRLFTTSQLWAVSDHAVAVALQPSTFATAIFRWDLLSRYYNKKTNKTTSHGSVWILLSKYQKKKISQDILLLNTSSLSRFWSTHQFWHCEGTTCVKTTHKLGWFCYKIRWKVFREKFRRTWSSYIECPVKRSGLTENKFQMVILFPLKTWVNVDINDHVIFKLTLNACL